MVKKIVKKPNKKVVKKSKKLATKNKIVRNRVIDKQKTDSGFFSRIFGRNVPDDKLSKLQHKSLKLILKKEKNVLKRLNKPKLHPEIKKNLGKIDELKKIDSKKIKKAKKPKNDNIVTKDGEEFIKTFVPGFDELLNPGIPKGAAVLVEGGPGSGKTLMCLTMLAELCKQGKKVLFMSFEEPEERLRQHIGSFGLDAREYEKKGLLYLKRFNALDIARSVEALLSEAKKELLIDVQPVLIPKDFKPDVVVLDSLSSISSAFSGESSRFRIYMEQLFRYLESHNINSFLIREVASPTHIGGTFTEKGEAVSFLSDGIIEIYNVIYKKGNRKRAIEILKMRGADVDRKICEYEITGKGVKVYSKKVLSGDYTLT